MSRPRLEASLEHGPVQALLKPMLSLCPRRSSSRSCETGD